MQAGRYTIELKELSWWESQEIQSVMISGAKIVGGGMSGIDADALMRSKMLTFEKSIASIKEGDVEIPYSQSWIKGLTKEEGDALSEAIDELGKKK